MRPLLGVVVLFILGAASPAQEARDAARAIVSRPEYQSKLPDSSGEAVLPVTDAPRRFEAPVPKTEDGPFEIMVGMMAAMLLWGIVIVIVLALLVWLVREFLLRPPKRPQSAAKAAMDRDVDALAGLPTREDVLALAAAGRLDEAIHALFVRSVRVVGADTSTRDRALTAREIVARARLAPKSLAPESLAALAGIAEVTERTLFRHDPVDVDRFERCLAWHDRLAEGRVP